MRNHLQPGVKRRSIVRIFKIQANEFLLYHGPNSVARTIPHRNGDERQWFKELGFDGVL